MVGKNYSISLYRIHKSTGQVYLLEFKSLPQTPSQTRLGPKAQKELPTTNYTGIEVVGDIMYFGLVPHRT